MMMVLKFPFLTRRSEANIPILIDQYLRAIPYAKLSSTCKTEAMAAVV